jgi:hypothetical protein
MSPRPRARVDKSRQLTLEQELALAGFSSLEDTFVSPEHARETWFTHRERMMAYARDAQRPRGWWTFEAGEGKLSGTQNETARLAALGELTTSELAELRARGASPGQDPGKRPIAETARDRLWCGSR